MVAAGVDEEAMLEVAIKVALVMTVVEDGVDEETTWVADTAAELKEDGELPRAPATVAELAEALAVDEAGIPHAAAITASQSASAVFSMTEPEGFEPIIRPGYPHFPLHRCIHDSFCQFFLAQAGPANPLGITVRITK